jgi:hypothetical protein
MRLPKLLVIILVAMLLCASLQAAKSKSKPIDPAVKAKIDALQKELSHADAQMYAAFRKLEKNDAIVALRKAALDADRAYQKGKETDATIVEAKSVYRKASAQYKSIVLKKLKASPAGAGLLKEKSALDNKRAAAGLRAAVAEVKLTDDDSPVVRAMDADPILAQYKRAYYDAVGDVRDKARADYEKLKKATLQDMVAARTLMAEIKTAKAEADAAEEAMDAVDDKLDDLRRGMAKSDDPELKAAKAKVKTAHDNYEKAYYGGAIKALRDKREASKAAIRTGIKKLIANDPALSALSARIDTLNVEIKKLGGRPKRSSRRS